MSQVFTRSRLTLLSLRNYSNQRRRNIKELCQKICNQCKQIIQNLNYYELLKIPVTSSQKEIRDAFLKLSKEKHPDITGKADHDEFVQINEAYNTLSKEHLRFQYDEQLKCIHSRMYHQSVYDNYPSHTIIYKDRKGWEKKRGNIYEYDFNEKSEKMTDEKQRKNQFVLFIFFITSTITFVTQMILATRTSHNQREELRSYMKDLQLRREKAILSKEAYKIYVDGELENMNKEVKKYAKKKSDQ